MEQGPVEQKIILQAQRNRVALPDKIANAPELYSWLEWYYSAFLDLTSCRSNGFDEGSIPWTAIDAYARRYDITDEDEFYFFCGLIREVDSAYIKWRGQQRDKKNTTLGKGNAAPGPSKVVSKNPMRGK